MKRNVLQKHARSEILRLRRWAGEIKSLSKRRVMNARHIGDNFFSLL